MLLPSQRDKFDIPSDVAYFNCAYNTPLLNEARERLLRAAAAKSHPWERPASDFFEDADRLRTLASALFGGDSDGYAITPAASYGLSATARILEPTLSAGDRIIVMAEDFPSNVLAWRRTAAQTGAVLVTVPTPEDGDWTSALGKVIEQGAKVVTLANCHWTNGAPLDLMALSKASKAVGAALVLDMTQSLGAMPFSLAEVQPDFMIAAGYKWLLCPYGVSFMYVALKWRDARPLEEGWLNRQEAENFANLVNYNDAYMAGARRFDVGEKCTALLPGAIAALEQIQIWGIDNIAETLAGTNRRIRDLVADLGFILSPNNRYCPHMFGAQLPPDHTGDFISALRAQKIFVSQRGASIRFAPHLHVNDDDMLRLSAGLKVAVKAN